MPKITAVTRLSQYKEKGFVLKNGSLHCTLCEVSVEYKKKSTVDNHVNSANHQRNKASVQNQPVIKDAVSSKWKDMVQVFVAAGVPLKIFNNTGIRNWLKGNVNGGHTLPGETSLRRELVDLGVLDFETTMQLVAGKKICLIVDETSDPLNRKVFNILVKILDFEQEPRLARCTIIPNCDYEIVAGEVVKILTDLKIKFEDFLVLKSDNASYMIKAGKTLKGLCKNLIHSTCWAHILHLASEELRANLELSDSYISSMKKCFIKCPSRRDEFYAVQKCSGIEPALPPVPVLTRWTTWLETGSFHHKYFECELKWLNETTDESPVIYKLQKIIQEQEQELQQQLESISLIYPGLSSAIKELEKSQNLASDVWFLLKTVEGLLEEIGLPSSKLQKYFDKKHPALEFWKDVQCLDPRKIPPDFHSIPKSLLKICPIMIPPQEIIQYKILSQQSEVTTPGKFWKNYKKELPSLYIVASICLNVDPTSASVERSFSYLKKIQGPQRLNMTEATLSSHLRIYYNADKTALDVE